MGFSDRTNNRIREPNARAVDVATRAIEELTAVQQRKTHNAFIVQGFPALYYARVENGRKCSCASEQKIVNTLLDQEGKAGPGVINELLVGHQFGISRTGSADWSVPQRFVVQDDLADLRAAWTSPQQEGHEFESAFDLALGPDEEFPIGRHTVESDYGDNGPVRELGELASDFDPGFAGFGDYACPVCFGSSYVGGYVPQFGQRLVWAAHELTLTTTAMTGEPEPEMGYLELSSKPWAAVATAVQWIATLPKGCTQLIRAGLFDGQNQLPYRMWINGQEITGPQQLLSCCTGRPQLIVLRFPERQKFTHFELQVMTSDQSIYVEFPKQQKGSDLRLLDLTEPFQLLLSPNIPLVRVEDVIVDSVYGKAMIVQSVGPWQTRSSRNLGWEAQVRVLQPQEIPNLLPRLPRVPNKMQTTRMVRDNMSGPRRT